MLPATGVAVHTARRAAPRTIRLRSSRCLPDYGRNSLPVTARQHAAVATLQEVLDAAREGEGEAQSSKSSSSKGVAASEKGAVAGQQGVLWFANIYPTKAFRMDFRQALTHHNHETLIPKLLPDGVEVIRMVPREREGGAFVYFRAPPKFVAQVLKNLAEKEAAEAGTVKLQRFIKKGQEDILSKVCTGISEYLKKKEVRAYLCPFPVRAHRVLGDPYLEDLNARFPSSRLRIRVKPEGSISEERLFERLRRYGQLDDIDKLPDNKGFAVSYQYTAAAVAARNCLHRVKLEPEASPKEGQEALPDIQLQIEYEPFMRKWIREAITNNARYTIPLFIFMMLGTTYFIWDPLRTFSVQLRIAGVLSAPSVAADEEKAAGDDSARRAEQGGLWGLLMKTWTRWNQAQTQLLAATRTLRSGRSGRSLLADFWADRDREVTELKKWLSEPQDRVMLLTGHRGNGQSALVRDVLGIKAIYVDVAQMLEAGGAVDDLIFLRHLCKSVGYWPAQGMDRQMSALLDLMLPGSGKLSRESEIQMGVQRVLSTVTKALVAWRKRHADNSHKDDFSESGNVTHRFLTPLIVIHGFTAENKDRRQGFFDSLVAWAAYVSEAGLARVLFIADSSFAEPAMLAALGDRPERLDVQQLRDADTAAVHSILQRHFGAGHRACDLSHKELAAIGGRFRDISAFVASVHEGTAPEEAVRRLIMGAEGTVRNLFMRGQPRAKWTRPQLWRAVRLLAEAPPDEGVPYDVFLWSVFRGDEMALQSMKESNLIAVAPRDMSSPADPNSDTGRHARRFKVLPGSPLYAEVYWRLANLRGLAAVLDVEVAREDIKREQASLVEYEAQLAKLQEVDDIRHFKWRGLPDPNEALRKRKLQLLSLILEQHQKLEKFHKARRGAMETLGERREKFNAYARDIRDRSRSGSPTAAPREAGRTRGGLLSWLGYT